MNGTLTSDWIDALMEAFPGVLTKAPTKNTPPWKLFVWEWFLALPSPVPRARVLGTKTQLQEAKALLELWMDPLKIGCSAAAHKNDGRIISCTCRNVEIARRTREFLGRLHVAQLR